MKGRKMKFKKGATSFYIVAFSTLILVIIAASFTAVILSEMTRTANDDLAQSAYDSALAGVEDAKLALYNYQKCLKNSNSIQERAPDGNGIVTCEEIMYWMNRPSCDMVAKILGRITERSNGSEVLIEEKKVSGQNEDNMQQAYTCSMISGSLDRVTFTLSSSDTKVVRVKLGKDDEGNQIHAQDIKKVKVSWYSGKDNESNGASSYSFSNINNGNNSGIVFPSLSESAIPPMISVGLVQTAENFTMSQFTETTSTATNRATLFLVPNGTDNNGNTSLGSRSITNAQEGDIVGNYIRAEDDTTLNEKNVVGADLLVKSNDRRVKNLPIAVNCDASGSSEFACSSMLYLPDVIEGSRSDETFMFVISVPYGRPDTSFSLQFYCDETKPCGQESVAGGNGEQKPATLTGQLRIDSTGRANDLYRRVETILEAKGSEEDYPFPLYAIELLGNDTDGKGLLRLPGNTKCEYDEWGGNNPTCFR